MADPSARNSGLLDSPSSGPQTFSLDASRTGLTTSVVVPGVTVLLTTT